MHAKPCMAGCQGRIGFVLVGGSSLSDRRPGCPGPDGGTANLDGGQRELAIGGCSESEHDSGRAVSRDWRGQGMSGPVLGAETAVTGAELCASEPACWSASDILPVSIDGASQNTVAIHCEKSTRQPGRREKVPCEPFCHLWWILHMGYFPVTPSFARETSRHDHERPRTRLVGLPRWRLARPCRSHDTGVAGVVGV